MPPQLNPYGDAFDPDEDEPVLVRAPSVPPCQRVGRALMLMCVVMGTGGRGVAGAGMAPLEGRV